MIKITQSFLKLSDKFIVICTMDNLKQLGKLKEMAKSVKEVGNIKEQQKSKIFKKNLSNQ